MAGVADLHTNPALLSESGWLAYLASSHSLTQAYSTRMPTVDFPVFFDDCMRNTIIHHQEAALP